MICSIMERPPMKEVSAYCTVENFKFEWIVKNFSFLKGQKGTKIESPEFRIDINGDFTIWKIRLFPYGDSNAEDSDVGVYLALFDTNIINIIIVEWQFVLLNMQGKQIATRKFSSGPYTKGRDYGFCCIIKRDDLLKNISDSDNLKIIVNLKVYDYVENICSSISNPQPQIIDDLAKLRLDTDHSDILITVCGSEFKAHKAILAARSTVFSSMFKHNMKEANSGKIEIEDMPPEVFEEFLKFIYTGIANVEEYASELFIAADKYDMPDLKAVSEDGLIKNINTENCLKTLVLSDLHSSKKLKEKAMDFIVSNTHTTDKNKLAEIKNSPLALELLEAFMNHKK